MPTPNLSVRQPCATELLRAPVAPGAPRRDVRDSGNRNQMLVQSLCPRLRDPYVSLWARVKHPRMAIEQA